MTLIAEGVQVIDMESVDKGGKAESNFVNC